MVRATMQLAENAAKPKNVVYVTLRHAIRGKDGRLAESRKSQTITVYDATPQDVIAVLRKGITNGES